MSADCINKQLKMNANIPSIFTTYSIQSNIINNEKQSTTNSKKKLKIIISITKFYVKYIFSRKILGINKAKHQFIKIFII